MIQGTETALTTERGDAWIAVLYASITEPGMNRRDWVASSPTGMLVCIALAALAGCGKQQSNAPAVQSSTQSTVLPQQVNVSPETMQIIVGTASRFAVTVVPANAVNTVNWSVSGTGCSGAACGSIDSTGLYSAPSSPPSPSTVSVMATSTADQTRVGVAQVTVVPSQTRDFHVIGNMTVPRESPTAILLPDGRVLILGGEQSGPNAELYNPATETFQASTANITGIPLVLLNNGKLLTIDGGTAGLYDLKTDSTTPTGSLHVNHGNFAAT